MIVLTTRRAFLGAVAFPLSAQVAPPRKKSKPLPRVGEFVRIVDPVTENVVIRLTNLASSSILPLAHNRSVSTRERVLVFASNRNGPFAPFQIDLRTGAVRQIAETQRLNPRSLSLARQDKVIRYLDGGSLAETEFGHGSPKTLMDGVTTFSQTANGGLFLIVNGKLLSAEPGSGKAETLLAEGAEDVWGQPNAAGCLFSRRTSAQECELHYASAAAGSKTMLLASGAWRDPFWDVDGESILFLRDVVLPNGAVLAEIHGRSIRGGDEYTISWTSQFAGFAPNSDASVFVGASRSKAQPNIMLMLRSPHRELTLCEHKAANPREVTPIFSPDNRRVYFESDREGRPAIYSVNVELLVEPELSRILNFSSDEADS